MEDAGVFRTATPQPTEASKTPEAPVDTKVGTEVAIEPPFLDYESQASYPFAVEYFQLGDRWADPVGGFPKEVGIIEGYFKDKISAGEMANSISSVRNELKSILKLTNMENEERNLVKIETVAAYIKFLSERDDITRNSKQYAKRFYNSQ